MEIPSSNIVSNDIVLMVLPITTKQKHTYCTKLGVSGGPNSRHVYEPYTLNCSRVKQPEVTLDCGGGGDCFYRCPIHYQKTFFNFWQCNIFLVFVAGIYMLSQVS